VIPRDLRQLERPPFKDGDVEALSDFDRATRRTRPTHRNRYTVRTRPREEASMAAPDLQRGSASVGLQIVSSRVDRRIRVSLRANKPSS